MTEKVLVECEVEVGSLCFDAFDEFWKVFCECLCEAACDVLRVFSLCFCECVEGDSVVAVCCDLGAFEQLFWVYGCECVDAFEVGDEAISHVFAEPDVAL